MIFVSKDKFPFKYTNFNQQIRIAEKYLHSPFTITLWWLHGLQDEIQGLDADMLMLIQAESNSQIRNDISMYVAQLVIKLC